ncbi:MAG: hypothetical protein SGILL_002438, partial [Bacillariaceae sp.]
MSFQEVNHQKDSLNELYHVAPSTKASVVLTQSIQEEGQQGEGADDAKAKDASSLITPKASGSSGTVSTMVSPDSQGSEMLQEVKRRTSITVPVPAPAASNAFERTDALHQVYDFRHLRSVMDIQYDATEDDGDGVIISTHQDEDDEEEDEQSWATISEINSQYSFRSRRSMRSTFDLSLIQTDDELSAPGPTDTACVQDRDLPFVMASSPQGQDWDIAAVEPSPPASAAAVPRDIQVLEQDLWKVPSTAVADNSTSRSMQEFFYTSQQSGGDSTCERSGTSLQPSFSTSPQQPHFIPDDAVSPIDKKQQPDWRQRCLQAEDKVFCAREELAAVEAQLDSLQLRHAVEVREMHRQVADKTSTNEDLQATVQDQQGHLAALQGKLSKAQDETYTLNELMNAVHENLPKEEALKAKTEEQSKTIDDFAEQLRLLQHQKDAAETKLVAALTSLQQLQEEQIKYLAEQEKLKASLDSSQKRVRIAEERNEVLEYEVNEYKTKLEDSRGQTRNVKCTLARLEQNMEGIQKEHLSLRETYKKAESVHSMRSVELDQSRQQHEKTQSMFENSERERSGLLTTVEGMLKEKLTFQDELHKTTFLWKQTKSQLEEKQEESRRLQVTLRTAHQSVQSLKEQRRVLEEEFKIQGDEHAVALQARAFELDAMAAQLSEAQRLKEETEKDQDRLLDSVRNLEADKTRLETDYADAQLQLDETKRQIETMETEKQELQDRLVNLQSMVDGLDTHNALMVKGHEESLAAHSAELLEQHALVDSVNQRLQEAQLDRGNVQVELDELKTTRTTLEAKLSSVEEELLILQRSFDDSKTAHSEELLQRDAALKYLQDQLDVREREGTELHQRIEDMAQEHAELERHAEKLSQRLVQSEQLLVEAEQEKNDVVLKLLREEKCVQSLRDDLERELCDREEVLKSEKEALNARIEMLQTTKVRLEGQLTKDAESSERNIAALRQEIMELQSRISAEEGFVEYLKEDQARLIEFSDAAQLSHDQIMEKHRLSVQELQSQRASIQEERDSAKNEAADLVKIHDALQSRLQALESEHANLQVSHQQALQDLGKAVSEKEESVKASGCLIDSFQKEKDELNESVNFFEREARILKEQLADVNDSLNTATALLSKRVEDSNAMEAEVGKVKDSFVTLQKEHEKLVSERDAAHALHAQTVEDHRRAVFELQAQLKATEESEFETLERHRSLESQTSSLHDRRRQLETQILAVSKDLKETQVSAINSQQEKALLQQEVDSLKCQVASLKTNNSADAAEKAAVLAANALALKQHREHMDLAEERAQDALNELQVLKSEHATLQTTVETLRGEILLLSDELALAKVSADTAQKHATQAQQQREELQSILSVVRHQLDDSVQDKTRAMEVTEATASQHALALKDRKEVEDSLQSRIDVLQVERDALTSQIDLSKEESSKVRGDFDRLQNDHKELLRVYEDAEIAHHEYLKSTVSANKESSARLAEHQSQVAVLQLQVEQLQRQCRDSEAALQDLRAQFDGRNSQLSAREEEVRTTNERLKRAQSALGVAKKEQRKLLAEKEAQEIAAKKFLSLLDEKTAEIVTANAAHEALIRKHSSVENENERIKERLRNAETALQLAHTTVSQNEATRNILEEQLSIQKKDRSLLEKEKSKLQVALSDAKSAKESPNTLRTIGASSEAELAEEREKSESLNVENVELHTEKTLLEIQLQDMETDLKQSKEALANQKKEVTLLKSEVRRSDQRTVALELELSTSKKRIHDKKEIVRSELSSVALSAQAPTTKNEHLSSLEQEGAASSEKHAELSTRNEELEQDVAKLSELNKAQHTKIKKLGKLVQKILSEQAKAENDVVGREVCDFEVSRNSDEPVNLRRVSDMHVEVDLQYHDHATDETRTKCVQAKYSGPLEESVPHGSGVLKFEGGDLYVGIFEHGRMSNSGSNSGSYVRTRKHHRKSSKSIITVPGVARGTSLGHFLLIAIALLQVVSGFTQPPSLFFPQPMTPKKSNVPATQWSLGPFSQFSKSRDVFETNPDGGRVNLKVRSIMALIEERFDVVGNTEDNSPMKWKKTRNYLYNTAEKLPVSQVEAVLHFLNERFSPQVSMRVLQECPRILRKPVDSYLIPTADFLLELWGSELFSQAIKRNPSLLLSRGIGYVRKDSLYCNTNNLTQEAVDAPSHDVEVLLSNRTSLNDKAIEKLKRTSPFVFGLSLSKVTSVMDFLEAIFVDGNVETDLKTDVEKALGKIISSHPHLLNLSVEQNLVPRVDYLATSCNLDAAQMAKIVQGSSGLILGLSVTQNLKPTIEYIVSDIFGCTASMSYVEVTDTRARDDLRKCLLSHPQLLGLSLDNFKAKVTYLESRGTSLPARIASKCSAVFSLSLDQNIEPTIAFLESVWGVDEDPKVFETMLFEYPNILTLSLEGNLQPTMAFFNKTGYTSLDEEWALVAVEDGDHDDTPKQPDCGRIRGRYIAASLYSRLLPRWHYCFSKRTSGRESTGTSDAAAMRPAISKPPPLHLLVMASDQAFCESMGVDVGDYLAFKEEAIPRLKFSSQFDTWLKSGRPIEL